jgi:hypothetical protein
MRSIISGGGGLAGKPADVKDLVPSIIMPYDSTICCKIRKLRPEKDYC